MAKRTDDAERRVRIAREVLIWLGFAALLGAAAITVAWPELSEDPEDAAGTGAPDAGTAD